MMRLFSFLLTCLLLAPISARGQASVEYFIGPEDGPGFRDSAGTAARFNTPSGIWSDGTNLYVVDAGNAVIRKVTIAAGAVTTVIGHPQQYDAFRAPRAIWGDGTLLYVTDGTFIRKADPATGGVALFADTWYEPPPITPRSYIPPSPYALTGNASKLYVFYSAATSGTLLPIGVPHIREIALATGEARTLDYASHGDAMPTALWADDAFLYLLFAGGASGVSLGRMNVATYEFEPLFGFPLSGSAGPGLQNRGPSAANLWPDNAGHLFFTNASTVYEVDLSTGRVTTIGTSPSSAAGNRIAGLTGAAGLLFGTDSLSNVVFQVDPSSPQAVVTFAGAAPKSVAIEPPPSSTLFGVSSIWSDGRFVYAADRSNNVIQKIDIASGATSAFASSINDAVGLWGDASYLYVSRIVQRNVTRIALATGEISVLASGFFFPAALAGDADFVYVQDTTSISRIAKTTGAVTPVAGDHFISGYVNATGAAARFLGIQAMCSNGRFLYVADENRVRVVNTATGEVGTFAEFPARISALASDGRYLYAADSRIVRRVALATAEVTTFAGGEDLLSFVDGIGAAARFGNIQALWSDGVIAYAADGRLRRIDLSTAATTTLAGRNIVYSEGAFPAERFTTHSLGGNSLSLYGVNGYAVYKISPSTRTVTHVAGAFNESGTEDGPGATARFYSPTILWADERYVYIDEYVGLKIRRVDVESGAVTTLLSGISSRVGWGDGRYLYIVDEYDAQRSLYRVDVNTGEKALVARVPGIPMGLWGDAQYLYVTEYQCVIRRIRLADGAISVLAGHTDGCRSVDVKVPPADGTGTEAFFPDLGAITGDGKLLYVIDSTTVRSVDPQTGETHTIAGQYPINGNENGDGTAAHFVRTPDGKSAIWSDATNLYVAHGTIRRVVLARPLSRVPFAVSRGGGDYLRAAAASDAVRRGYARLQTAAGTSPAAVAIFSYRQDGILVSEASVPAAPPVQEGRIYAEVRGAVNTGIAIANANDLPATVSYYFTDSAGVNFGGGTTAIAAHSQIAGFFSEPPFRPGAGLADAHTFTFAASAPVGVIALRGYTNERSEFLMTTLPVAPLTSSSGSELVLPHFADGGGWRTQVLLVNPTGRFITGTLTMNSVTAYSIPPRSALAVASPDTDVDIHTGSIRISPSPLSASPVASTVFSFQQSGVVVTESGTAATPVGRSLELFAETGTVRTGLAVMNTGQASGSLQFTLRDFAGTDVAASDTLTLDAGQRLSMFIDELPGFGILPAGFRGVLTISANVPVSAIGLRGQYNERGDFVIATAPAIAEDAMPVAATQTIIPHIVTGSGYSTEFLLLSTGAGATGDIDFVSQSGDPLSLPIQTYTGGLR